MERKSFGWTDVQVPTIGQGTWRMGESRREREREVEALRLGIDLGMTHIDTAEMYGSGTAEEIVAAAIRGYPRNELFIVSKVLPQNGSYRGTIRAAENSLKRLATDYLDLLLLHWPGSHPIADTMRAMEELAGSGKIRFFGVSNFDLGELREAMATLKHGRLACNQVLYHLGERGIERELIPFCQQHGIAVVGYTPFGKGRTAGGRAAQILADIGQRHGRTPRQVMLRFLTRAPGLFAIPKASASEHVRENAGGADFTLSAADVDAIDQAFPAPRRPVPLATA